MRRPGVELAAITRYLNRCRSVPGWLERSDGQVIARIGELQTLAGFTGNMLEIGAYRGRSAILLGYLLAEGERLFVCDTFEDQPVEPLVGRSKWVGGKRRYPGLAQASFEDNYAKHHELPAVIVRMPSAELLAGGLVVPPLRIVHVDGSHEPDVMLADIATARALLAEGGVVIFEDDHSLKNPAIAPAVRGAVERDELELLCATPWKLYATAGPDVLGLRAALETWAGESGVLRAERHPFAGRELLSLHPLPARPGPSRRLARKVGVALGS